MDETDRIAGIARWHLTFALLLAVLGMLLGIAMAMRQDHAQHVTHAHLLLLGFVVSALYGVIYRLWLPQARPAVALAQTALHQLGTLGIVGGLFLLYGRIVPEPVLGPWLGVASVAALLGALAMLVQFVRAPRAAQRLGLDRLAAPQS